MDDNKQGDSNREAARKARLAETLRANLQKRKAQARSRRSGEADQRPEGLAAPGEKRGG
ncbi:MAG: hypothetical protein AB7S80_16670 [Rhizobiaceae bacterium]